MRLLTSMTRELLLFLISRKIKVDIEAFFSVNEHKSKIIGLIFTDSPSHGESSKNDHLYYMNFVIMLSFVRRDHICVFFRRGRIAE